MMTGTAIYNLQQKGQLNWNTPLSKYYPQVSGSSDITIHELMNHTSGLINNARPSEPLKIKKSRLLICSNTCRMIIYTWDYQDVDYELLAAIISKRKWHKL